MDSGQGCKYQIFSYVHGELSRRNQILMLLKESIVIDTVGEVKKEAKDFFENSYVETNYDRPTLSCGDVMVIRV